MELKDIKAIIDLMKKNSITEFELEEKDSKLRLKRGLNGGTPVAQYDEPAPIQLPIAAPVAVATTATPTIPTTAPATGELDIKSPMIGTFYRTPSPESAAYVEVGTEVNPESVVCIIEAMKVMNEIKAEVRGVVTQILVDGGKPVEFGQPLFKVRPS
ncbi:MAG: acetyl-CoA carboxylase biotin carboxyl carrier protein [Verrucomicrobiota bacterium]